MTGNSKKRDAHYTEKTLENIETEYLINQSRYQELFFETFTFANQLRNQKAKEFLVNGVSRRLQILKRSVNNIFRLFPANRIEQLIQDDRIDLEINLHAFLINIYGVLDNIGLALGYENNLIGIKIDHNEVNLFKKQFQKLLNPTLSEYLREESLKAWYKNYAKNYRDAPLLIRYPLRSPCCP